MLVTIINLATKPAKKYLEDYRKRFPPFVITKNHTFNGVVVEVDEEDVADFIESAQHAGFSWISDDYEE